MNRPAIDEIVIFLSGSLKKGSSDSRPNETYWSAEEEEQIIIGVFGKKVLLLNPARFIIHRNDYYANFGCDLHFITQSDVILVDLRAKKGIGIGAEMMFAQTQGVTVISICPPNSFYKREFVPDVFGEDLHKWTHPFVHGLSDYIVNNLTEAIETLNILIKSGSFRKTPNSMNRAINYYKRQIHKESNK